MSGSSLDGIDIASVVFGKDQSFDIEEFDTFDIPEELSKRLSNSAYMLVVDYLMLESEYTKFISKCIEIFKTKIKGKSIDLISIHGHTVSHNPTTGYSEQMVNGGWLSAKICEHILVDFRNQDIGKGGQGAPLAPVVEKLFPHFKAFCNLGGIANISIHKHDKVVAYDIGPCNQLFNYYAGLKGLKYDINGDVGRRGTINSALKNSWKSIEYFDLKGAKSIDNEWLKSNFLINNNDIKIEDILATGYDFVSDLIADSIMNELDEKSKIMFTGGGAHNNYLMDLIISKVTNNIQIHMPEKTIIDYKECLLMAYLGYLYLKNIPSTIPSSTNSRETVMAGAYYRGK